MVTYGTRDGAVYASGLLPGTDPASGLCTLTAQNGDDVRYATVDAVASPTAVNCGLASIAVPPGTWTIQLTYTSSTLEAVSESAEVSVS